MLLLFRPLLVLVCSLLIGCSASTDSKSPQENALELAEVANHYNGSITITEMVTPSAKTGTIVTHYLKVDLRSPGLQQYYGAHLDLPATACAFEAWHQLTLSKRLQTNYLKVTLNNADSISTYTIPASDLTLVDQVGKNLTILITNLRKRNIAAIANAFDIDGQEKYPLDSLEPRLTRITKRLAPLQEYIIEGFLVLEDTTAQKRSPRVKFFLSIPHSSSQPPYLLTTTLTYRVGSQKFIHSMDLIK